MLFFYEAELGIMVELNLVITKKKEKKEESGENRSWGTGKI